MRDRFGDAVATMVMVCNDGTVEDERAAARGDRVAYWRRRKLESLDHLGETSSDALVVFACDKLHNARSIVTRPLSSRLMSSRLRIVPGGGSS